MSDALSEMGRVGALRRVEYNEVTGEPAGEWGTFPWDGIDLSKLPFSFKMSIVPLASVGDLDGRFKHQRYAALISKRLAERAGWSNGSPRVGDLIEAEGQVLIVEHVTQKGFEDDLVYYCQCSG